MTPLAFAAAFVFGYGYAAIAADLWRRYRYGEVVWNASWLLAFCMGLTQ